MLITRLTNDIAELLVIDYDKVLKNEENVDISNFENYEYSKVMKRI